MRWVAVQSRQATWALGVTIGFFFEGLDDARETARAAARLVGCAPEDVMVSSTGVIGVPLPKDKARAGIEAALVAETCGWEDATNAIGTTDTFAKGAGSSAMVGGTRVELAGIIKGVFVFCLPGSNGAVKDGWDGILAEQLDSRNRPCNFVDLMPRLREK